MTLIRRLIGRLGERLTYVLAQTAAGLFTFTAVLAWVHSNHIASVGWSVAALNWELLCRAIWHWWPGLLHKVRVATAMRILEGLNAARNSGIEGYQMWLRDVASQVGLQVTFQDAPNGTPGAAAQFYVPPKGAVIGVHRH